MAITSKQFQRGMHYDGYKAQMTRNRDRLQLFEETVVLPAEDLRFFAELDRPLRVLVLTEDWCDMAIVMLPMLGRLAAECGKLDLRIFLRDEHPEIMDLYLRNGEHRTIPTVVFFTEAFQQLGIWYESPAKIIPLMEQMKEDLMVADPDLLAVVTANTPPNQWPRSLHGRVKEAFLKFYADTRQFSNSEAIREMHELVEAGLSTKG